MSSEPRRCPFCGSVMAPGQRTCPNPECGNPYPFDDEQATNPPPGGTPTRSGRQAGGGAARGGEPGRRPAGLPSRPTRPS